MKKTLMFLSALLLWSACVAAQTTAVTATVVDSDSTVWANAPWSLSFQVGPYQSNPAAYTIGGVALDPAVTQQSGAANGSGVITFTVYRSTSVSPIGSSWNLNVCPNASSRCSSFNFSTSGATLNLSAQINAGIVAPRFQAVSGSYGYNDGEALLQLKPASTYWNVTSSVSRCYTGSAWGACSAAGGTPTALSPNPTLVGQTWGWLPGAAPNQGWTATNILQASLTDFGGACDGVTPDDAAFAEAQVAGVLILIIPPTCAGNSVVSTPLDLRYLYTLIAYVGITYTGTDAGPGIKIAGQSINYPLQIKRGTTTAGQILLEVSPSVNFTSQFPGLLVYNADGSTDNNFTSVHFKAASGGALDVGNLYTDSPITVDASANLNVNSGTINNLNGLTYNSGDPIQMAGSASTKLSLNNVTMFDGKTSSGCFIPLKNNGGSNPAQINLHNVQFIPAGSFSGHGICGPSTTGSTTDIVNGDVETAGHYDPSWTVNGQVDGHLMMVGTNFAGVVSPAIDIVNGIAANFFYSAAGVAIPTPYSAQSPALTFVSDQTTACTGTYTSGGVVKCKVWWNGSAWTAF